MPIPRPAPAPAAGAQASSLTFFLSAAQRARVLAHLRSIRRDRTSALLIALRLPSTGDPS